MNIKTKSWPIRYPDSIKSVDETNDCVVRSITETFALPYDEAHHIVETKFGRQKRKGTKRTALKFVKLQEESYEINGYGIENIPSTSLTHYTSKIINILGSDEKEYIPITVERFIKNNPNGRFVIFVRGHAFSVVNGTIIGNKMDGDRLSRKILNAVKAVEQEK